MTPLEILGIASAILALAAFVGNEWKALSADSIWYDALNFVSALGLFYFAYRSNVLPFMITNSVWGIVSGIDVVRDLMRPASPRRKARRLAR